MPHLINNTSVEDMSCSLKLMNPKTGFEIRDTLELLNDSLADETKFRNRATVIRLLQAKINKVKKLKPGR